MTIDADIETVVGRMVELVRMLRRVPHDLFRHAADIDTGPAQPPVLGYGDTSPVFGGSLCVCKATAAPSYHEEIEFFRHIIFPYYVKTAAKPGAHPVLICGGS